jgi:hypothetical protein
LKVDKIEQAEQREHVGETNNMIKGKTKGRNKMVLVIIYFQARRGTLYRSKNSSWGGQCARNFFPSHS